MVKRRRQIEFACLSDEAKGGVKLEVGILDLVAGVFAVVGIIWSALAC